MSEQFVRTELLLGQKAMERLHGARVAVFGLGGVGGHAAEALARSGVGHLELIDDDRICLSNINRQIFALYSTLGQYKVDVARARLLDINPEMTVHIFQTFYGPETADRFDLSVYDYIVDAIDTVSSKLELAVRAQAAGVPIISSMGTGNKLDPTAFRTADIYDTSVCPLARVMRRELKKRGVEHLKVVYSQEEPIKPENAGPEDWDDRQKHTPGSTAFAPAVAGLVLAGEVVRDLCGLAR